MPELTPLDDNRQEHFLNGEDLEPITRREHFYAGRESELPAGHQEPETREEWFIQKYRGGGGDVTVVPLSVTENGTYSEEGKAYSPVSVNVPLPTNAYLLKSVSNLPQAIASFSDGEDMVMPTLKVAIEPQQDLSHGDPSPENICPISGWSAVNVNRAKVYQICEPSDSTEITANGVTMTYLGKGKYRVKGTLTTNEYTYLNLPIVPFTIYGGDDCYIKLNNSVGLSAVSIIFKNNSSQVDSWGLYPSNRSGSYVGMRNKYTNNIAIEISSSEYGTNFDFTFKVEILSNSTANLSTYNISFGSVGTVYGGTLDVVSGVMTVDRAYGDLGSPTWSYINNRFYYNPTNAKVYKQIEVANLLCSQYPNSQYNSQRDNSISSYAGYIYVRADSYSGDTSAFKQAMNGVQLVYELATPLTIQLTPTVVKSLLGQNNIWADTGDITDAEYFSKEV